MNSGRSSPLRALLTTYGEEGLSYLRRPLSKTSDSALFLPKSIHVKDVKAPLIGALFVATGCTAREAASLLKSFLPPVISDAEPSPSATLHWRRCVTSNSSDSAHALTEALRIGRITNRGEARQIFPIPFWQLYFSDIETLNAILPPMRGTGAIFIPDIADDRKVITTRECGKFVASAWERAQAKARAFVRDREWLDTVILAPDRPGTGSGRVGLRWKAQTPTTVDEARAQLEISLASSGLRTRTQLRARRAHVFWLLVLRDSNWFHLRVPPGRGEGNIFFPSIAADRTTMSHKLDQSRESREAQIRAHYRDSDWLFERRKEARLEVIEISRSDITQKVIAAREVAMNRAGKPQRWQSSDAARAIGRSSAALRGLIKRFPELQAICREEIADYIRRLIEWGVKEAVASEKPLRIPDLCSSVWSIKACRILAYQIRNEVLDDMQVGKEKSNTILDTPRTN